MTLQLSWEGDADLDMVAYCYYWDSVNAIGWYSGIFQAPGGGGLADLTNPEQGTSLVRLEAGMPCMVAVLPFSGSADYELSFGAVAE